MREIAFSAYAKINLNLHIFPKRRFNGYFGVKFLNCQADLHDTLFFKKTKNELNIDSNNTKILNDQNLVWKTAQLLIGLNSNRIVGANIYIDKKIPCSAGLGGGSADAAATLLALNKLWDLKLSKTQLLSLAKKLGKDVCYCLFGKLCLVSKAGEEIEKIPFTLPEMNVIIISPTYTKPSTAWAYRHLDLKRIGKNEKKLKYLLWAIREGNIKKIAENLHNDFEYSLLKMYPEVNQIKSLMIKTGALNSLLCGSGLSVFGIYPDFNSAKKAYVIFKNKFPKAKTFLTKIHD